MSSSLLLQQCPAVSGSSNLYSFRDGGGASVRIVGISWGVVARTCSILLSTFLCCYYHYCQVHSMGRIELNCVLKQNGIV